MRIVHLSVGDQLSSGQAKQLAFEAAAAKRLQGVVWHTYVYHTGPRTAPFVHTIPRFFHSRLLRKLYGWCVALRLSRQYDIVMMRHMTNDPCAILFAPFIRNRVSVHHAREIDELKLNRKPWKGWILSNLERVTGKVSATHAAAILGVTGEIALYERDLHAVVKPINIYPNGIDPSQIALLEDKRSIDSIQVAFMCAQFSEWHGLDRLIKAVDAYAFTSERPLTIHLIGHLDKNTEKALAETEARRRVFHLHGAMNEEDYRKVMCRCDAGIASLAMDRQNLREGSTLKVREMLAMGLAVYSGHEDFALPSEQPFVKICRAANIDEIIEFAGRAKNIPRQFVRDASLDRIDKQSAMEAVLQFFRDNELSR